MNYFKDLAKDLRRNKSIYLLALPMIAFYVLFHYKPMYGALIAFYDYSPARGIKGSEFIGLENFIKFFESPYFSRTLGNTLIISVVSTVFSFPAPIILALMLNEVKNMLFKRTVQTLTYIPHFISVVVVCGMIKEFCLSDGLFNDIVSFFGGNRIPFLQKPEYFRTIYILSDIWQEIGWGSILYLSALAGVDSQLYEAANIDGAGKWKQLIHITIPGIMPTIMIQLILRIGSLMNVGHEKILLLYNPAIYKTSDVISTYTYRLGFIDKDWGFSTAIGLFNSVVNCILLVLSNYLSKKYTENSLW